MEINKETRRQDIIMMFYQMKQAMLALETSLDEYLGEEED